MSTAASRVTNVANKIFRISLLSYQERTLPRYTTYPDQIPIEGALVRVWNNMFTEDNYCSFPLKHAGFQNSSPITP